MGLNVFVWCELAGGALSSDSLALIAKARELCNGNGTVTTVLVSSHQAEPFGADVSIQVELDCRVWRKAEILTQIVKKHDPDVILFSADVESSQAAAHVAARLETGLCADCTGLWMENGLLVMHRPAFGGGVEADIVCPKHRPQMATVRPGIFGKITPIFNHPSIQKFQPTDLPQDPVELIESILSPASENIRDADIIVAGGLGVGSKSNFELLVKLANCLGGQIGASRGAVDAGFTDWKRQIGQTGSVVRPKLYLAFGISGAVQHIAGIYGAKYVISVNLDPKAPIFDYSDYAIVDDWRCVAEKLLQAFS